jgi:polysaccharide export outer membrane protein
MRILVLQSRDVTTSVFALTGLIRPEAQEAVGRSRVRAQGGKGRVLRAASACFAFLLALGPFAASAAQYKIQAGDVLEFSVASLPILKQRAAVDINGDVNFPLLQDIHAVGLPLAELRTRVRELISAKPFRQRGSEGRETLLTIDPDEITISIVEYRPIYITGDVGRPGEQPFRPGITVRQAIALGGGYDSAQLRLGSPNLQLADLRGDYQTLSASILGNRSLISRLEAELNDRATIEQALMPSLPVDAGMQRSIMQREGDELAARVKDYQNEKVFLARSIDAADKFLSVLSLQQENEKQGAELDAQDFDRVNALFAKGSVPITRVMDARRAMLLSSTRQLQTSVQVSENQIRREDLIRSVAKLDDQRRADLLLQLQTASLANLELQAKLRAVTVKLALLGKAGDSAGPEPQVEVYRSGQAAVTAADDTELQPGDVVKVKARDELLAATAVR